MSNKDYANWVGETINYPHAHKDVDEQLLHFGIGLGGETGEVLEYIKKKIFGHNPEKLSTMEDLKGELGDVLWYLTALCVSCGYTLEQVMDHNYQKIRSKYGEENISCLK